jgi:hypothetical protein
LASVTRARWIFDFNKGIVIINIKKIGAKVDKLLSRKAVLLKFLISTAVGPDFVKTAGAYFKFLEKQKIK